MSSSIADREPTVEEPGPAPEDPAEPAVRPPVEVRVDPPPPEEDTDTSTETVTSAEVIPHLGTSSATPGEAGASGGAGGPDGTVDDADDGRERLSQLSARSQELLKEIWHIPKAPTE